jgi:hypothetical protein
VDASRFAGRPEFKDGKALGYFVWQDGDTWKVRWTTFGAEHVFNGRVVLDGGEIQSLKRVDVDSEQRVVRRGQPAVRGPHGLVVRPGRGAVVASREEDHIEQESETIIRWRTRTDNDTDGFDFKVKGGTERLRFALQIDEKPRPEEVEVGRGNFKPNENPLVVRLR